jgi:hypothetical protein
MPVKKGRAPEPNFLNSNSQEVLEDLEYTKEDIEHVINWTKRTSPPLFPSSFLLRSTNPFQGTSKPPGTASEPARWRPRKAIPSSSTASSTNA